MPGPGRREGFPGWASQTSVRRVLVTGGVLVVDRDAWARAAAGDRAAFELLCTETWRDLYYFAYWHVQNRQEAEDVTQETFARLWSALPGLRNPDVEITRLLRIIALNIIRDAWRRKHTRGVAVPLHLVPEASGLDDTSRIEQETMVRSALLTLPEEQRAVIDLRLLKGYSVRETARILGKTREAVRALQYRGLVKVAEALGIKRKGRRAAPGERRGRGDSGGEPAASGEGSPP